jgi:hypothetical protein
MKTATPPSYIGSILQWPLRLGAWLPTNPERGHELGRKMRRTAGQGTVATIYRHSGVHGGGLGRLDLGRTITRAFWTAILRAGLFVADLSARNLEITLRAELGDRGEPSTSLSLLGRSR